jgi:hypothetical protein
VRRAQLHTQRFLPIHWRWRLDLTIVSAERIGDKLEPHMTPTDVGSGYDSCSFQWNNVMRLRR